MESSGSVFTQAFQDITTTKLEELAKKRTTFEKEKESAIIQADEQDDSLDMLTALADGIKTCFSIVTRDGKIVKANHPNNRLATDLRNLGRFIDQARFDTSISSNVIQQWRQALLKHLDTESLKFQYADLYGRLTVEWLTSSEKSNDSTQHTLEKTDEFEEIAVRRKLEARQEWEKTVFEEAEVDQAAIDSYLRGLFASKEVQQAIQRLRQEVSDIENVLNGPKHFDHISLGWCIRSLLSSDRLSSEKQQVLKDFGTNEVIIRELADVLNMRMARLSSWSWGDMVQVEARRELNGKFNIYLHEDLIQAIFLEYVGIKWTTMMKKALMQFQANTEVWKSEQKRLAPLDIQNANGIWMQIATMIDDVDEVRGLEEGDMEADFGDHVRSAKKKRAGPPPAAARESAPEEEADEDEDMGFALFDDGPSPDLSKAYKPQNSVEARQKLLHLLSTEILVKTRLQGEITCLRTQYDSWYPSLPHTTVISVLSFFGVSDKWLKFFKSFLQAPLKFLDEDEPARMRMRGTPTSHVISDLFGEMTLFCLDFEVNQQAEGEKLWRMKDDMWFWSSCHGKCVQIWQTIQRFNMVMGLRLDVDKSAAVHVARKDGKIVPAGLDKSLPRGQIRWGMIFLDGTNGRFTIDEEMVDKHIEELRKQLKGKEKSIFSWIQAYSVYAAGFFTSNFGKPANCFGRQHIDSMLSMHKRIQTTLFSNTGTGGVSNVVEWLQRQIELRFGVKNVPVGYLYFPAPLGGLDVKNPFIGPLQLRNSVTQDPKSLLDDFAKAEQQQYDWHKKSYYERKPWEYVQREKEYLPEDPQQFLSFEEYTKFRENLDYNYTNQLRDIFENLQKQPKEEPVELCGGDAIGNALDNLLYPPGQPTTISAWKEMEPYWKWVTMLYGPEVIDKFAGFAIVDPGLLPIGMASLFKSRRVSWQE